LAPFWEKPDTAFRQLLLLQISMRRKAWLEIESVLTIEARCQLVGVNFAHQPRAGGKQKADDGDRTFRHGMRRQQTSRIASLMKGSGLGYII
jgi:hypothetical protein